MFVSTGAVCLCEFTLAHLWCLSLTLFMDEVSWASLLERRLFLPGGSRKLPTSDGSDSCRKEDNRCLKLAGVWVWVEVSWGWWWLSFTSQKPSQNKLTKRLCGGEPWGRRICLYSELLCLCSSPSFFNKKEIYKASFLFALACIDQSVKGV